MFNSKVFSSKKLLKLLHLKIGDTVFLNGEKYVIKYDPYNHFTFKYLLVPEKGYSIPVRRFLDIPFTIESGKEIKFSSQDLLKILRLRVGDKIKIVPPYVSEVVPRGNKMFFTLEYNPDSFTGSIYYFESKRKINYPNASRELCAFEKSISFPLRLLIDIPFSKVRKED